MYGDICIALILYAEQNSLGLYVKGAAKQNRVSSDYIPVGGPLAGLMSDLLQARAFTSATSLIFAIPFVSIKLLYVL